MKNASWTDDTRPFSVHCNPDRWPEHLRGATAAMGNFDGLHHGHQEVIRTARWHAVTAGRPAVVITFEPHPRRFLRPDQPLARLTPLRAKAAALRDMGIGGVMVLRFNAALAALSAESFVQDILLTRLGIGAVVVGRDFRFGQGRSGDLAFLEERLVSDAAVIGVDAVRGTDGQRTSSTLIRRHLEEGRIESAAELLGRPYAIVGRSTGQSRSDNLCIASGAFLHPRPGHYRVHVSDENPGGRSVVAIAKIGNARETGSIEILVKPAQLERPFVSSERLRVAFLGRADDPARTQTDAGQVRTKQFDVCDAR